MLMRVITDHEELPEVVDDDVCLDDGGGGDHEELPEVVDDDVC